MSLYRAISKYNRISPFKVRRIATHLRNKNCFDANGILNNLPHKGAKIIKKVLKSAVANAINKNKNLDEEMLFIKELLVDEGPRMKRIWRRARGRADFLLKRMTHVSVVVQEIKGTGA